MSARKQHLRITHRESGLVLADGPLGWGMTAFDGAFYIRARYLHTDGLRVNFLPGLCVYKFLYVWMDLQLPDGGRVRSLAWRYWLPNPLLPFIWFRVAMPADHAALAYERYQPVPADDEAQPELR